MIVGINGATVTAKDDSGLKVDDLEPNTWFLADDSTLCCTLEQSVNTDLANGYARFRNGKRMEWIEGYNDVTKVEAVLNGSFTLEVVA